MDLSPEVQQRFEAATNNQYTYQPADGVRRVIKSKAIAMIVAPAAMGKSHIISRAVAADPRFAHTISFSTRDPRAGDEGNMRTIPRDNEHISLLLDLIESGQVVNYTIFPTTGMLYGTDLASYPGEINLMPALANSVNTIRGTGFGKNITIGLVAPPATWQGWFNARFPESTPEKTARLKEALLSVAWLLEDTNVRWVINRDGEADAVAQELIAVVDADTAAPNPQAITYAGQLRELITQMIQ